ncbi:MAG: amidase [Pseudomonadota bacterium]
MSLDPQDPFLSLATLSDSYGSGETKPSDVTRAHLDRIERLQPKIGAFQAVYVEGAMQAAEAADKMFLSGHRIGPFHGIPFGLKDICDVEGRVTTGGSKAMADRISPVTGTVAQRLISAGGVLIGKTKTVECALGGWGTNQHMGTPWNPWDMQAHRVPGGSSAGTGAGVAAGFAVCGVGTDTGGSVRLPAAFCGLAGLKVTANRLPTDGILPLSHTLDTPGPLARSVEDAIMMFLVMDGMEGWRLDQDRKHGTGLFAALREGVRGLRLGTLDDQERAQCTPDVLAAYDAALDRLQHLGAVLEVFHSPRGYGDLTAASGRLIAAEGFHHHGHLYDDPEKPMDEDVRTRMLAGKHVSAADYLAITDDRAETTTAYLTAMKGFDAILTPTMTTAAPLVKEVDQAVSPAYFTRHVNYLGMCAMAVPTDLTPGGLPTSLQIIARAKQEHMALRIGASIEAHQGQTIPICSENA